MFAPFERRLASPRSVGMFLVHHTISVGDLATHTQLARRFTITCGWFWLVLAGTSQDQPDPGWHQPGLARANHDSQRVDTSAGNVPGASNDPRPTRPAAHYHLWLVLAGPGWYQPGPARANQCPSAQIRMQESCNLSGIIYMPQNKCFQAIYPLTKRFDFCHFRPYSMDCEVVL